MNDSSTVVLGAYMNFSGTVVTPVTETMVDLTNELNAILRDIVGDERQWSTIVIEKNTIQEQTGHGYAHGTAFSFVHGKHEGLAKVGSQELRTGTLLQHDASRTLRFSVFKGFRVVVTAFLHRFTDALFPHQVDRLRSLGFNLLELVVQPALGALSFNPVEAIERTCIELCCSRTARLECRRHIRRDASESALLFAMT